MHGNERFLKTLDEVQLLELQLEAEARGAPYVQALKEQRARLGI